MAFWWARVAQDKVTSLWPATLQPLRGTEILISQSFSVAGFLSGVFIHSPPQVKEIIAPLESFSHSSFRACSFTVLSELFITVIDTE